MTEKWTCMCDITEELMDLAMEPKPESLWWTISCEAEEN